MAKCLIAGRQGEAGVNAVFDPGVRLPQKDFQLFGGFSVAAGIVQLASEVEPHARLKCAVLPELIFQNPQVAARFVHLFLAMAYRNIAVNHLAGRCNGLMNGAGPAESAAAAYQPFPVAGKHRSAVLVEGGVIRHHNDIRIRHVPLEFEKFCPVLRFNDVVRIQPHLVIHAGFGKRKVPRGGKIVPPGIMIYTICIFLCYINCPID